MSRHSSPSWDRFHRDSNVGLRRDSGAETARLRAERQALSLPPPVPPQRPSRPEPPRPSAPEPAPAQRRRGLRRVGRYALGLAAGLGLTVTFAGSFAAALLLHLNVPASRRAVASIVSDVASSNLQGKIELAELRHVGMHDLDVGRVTIRDPQGREVIVARDTKVAFDVVSIVKGALGDKPFIGVDSIALREVDVTLIDDGTGAPTIGSAFAPKNPKPKEPPKDSDLRITLRRIDLALLKVDGTLSGKTIHTVGSLENASVATDPFAGTTLGLTKLDAVVAPIEGVTKLPTTVALGTTVHLPAEESPPAPGVDLKDLALTVTNGAMVTKVNGGLENGAIDAKISAHAGPDDIVSFTGQPPPLWAPVDLDVAVKGTMDVMDVDASAVLGAAKDGSAHVKGTVNVAGLSQKTDADHPRIVLGDATIELANIDARAFSPTAPALRASAALAVHASAVPAGTEISFVAQRQVLDPSLEDPFAKKTKTFAGQTLIALDGKALLKNGGGVAAVGNAAVSIERTRADVGFKIDTGPASSKASIVAHVSAPSLSELRVVKSPLRGAIELDLVADADLAAQTFVASGQLRGTEIRKDNARIASLVVDLGATGTFKEPAFSAKVTAPTVEVLDPQNPNAPPVVRDLVLDVFGTQRAIGVATKFTTAKDQKIELATHVVPTKTGVRFVGVDAKLARKLFRAELKVKELAIDNGNYKLVGFRLSSTGGGLRIDGAWSPKKHLLDLDIASTELDIPTLAYAAGFDLGKMESTVTIEGKLKTVPRKQHPDAADGPSDTNGMLAVQLDAPTGKPKTKKIRNDEPVLLGHLKIHSKGKMQLPGVVPAPTPEVGAYEGKIEIDVDDRLVSIGFDAQVRDLVRVALHGGGALAGRYDDPRAWKDAVGHLALSIPDVDLARMAKFVGDLQGKPLPLNVTGNASLYAQLLRPDAALPPMGTATLSGKNVVVDSPTFSLEAMDFDVRTRLARSDDKTKPADDIILSLGAELRDAQGTLAKLETSTDATWSKLRALATGTIADPKGFLAEMPVYARLVIPKRPVKQFPTIVAASIPVDGDLFASVTLDGTVGQPALTLDTQLSNVKAGTGEPHTFSIKGDYDGKLATVHAAIYSEKTKNDPRLTADAEVKVDSQALLTPAPGTPLPWTAKADVALKGLPLAMLSSLSAVQIAGVAYGEVHVDHINDPAAKSASVNAKVDVDSLTIGDSAFEKASLEAKVDDVHAGAKLALEGESGSAHATVDVPLQWKTALSPGLAPGGKITGAFDAKNFRLRTIEPFATPFDSLDGFLDADVKIAMTPNGKDLDGGATGTIKLREGVMIVSAIGERWEGVNGEFGITPQKIEVKNLTLEGHTGHAKVSASLTMLGLTPQKLHAQLDAKRFPVATNGVPVGNLSGKIVVDGDLAKKEGMDFVVTIDPMTVDLAPTSGKHPQDLEPEPSIVIMQPVEEPRQPPSQNPLPMKIAIHMPNNVWIRREDLRMAVTGDAAVTIKQVASITGEVRVDEGSHGYADVFGKRFVVDHAKVTFDGSPEINPVLDIAVKWEAPDGSNVTIAVAGRMQQPKVTMSSDPPGTQAEIMSLLVLGRRDAGSAQQQDQASKGAAAQTAAMVQGMTGAIVGQQLQKALPTSMSLSFQPGDKGFADAKYGGGYQKGKFYFEVGYNAGAGNTSGLGGPGTSQYQPRTTFGVEYRFKPMWSLMTTLGDTGSALVDLLWSYRY